MSDHAPEVDIDRAHRGKIAMPDRPLTREDLTANGAYGRIGAEIVPGVITREALLTARREIFEITESGAGRHIQAPELFHHPRLMALMFHAGLLDSLRRIFGKEICYYPNVQIQMNSFTQPRAGKVGGWHIDASREARDVREYVFLDQPMWGNVGLYFQDAHNGTYGGGIMIVPGSHRYFSRFGNFPKLASVCHEMVCHVTQVLPAPMPDAVVVPTLPGDAVIFDSRLLHTSIPTADRVSDKGRRLFRRHQSHVANVPPERHKYVLYWFVSNTRLASTVLENNFYRRAALLPPDYAASGGFDYHKLCRVAESPYPDDMIALAREQRVHLVSGPPEHQRQSRKAERGER